MVKKAAKKKVSDQPKKTRKVVTTAATPGVKVLKVEPLSAEAQAAVDQLSDADRAEIAAINAETHAALDAMSRTDPPELTPREYIEKGLAYLQEAQEKYDLALYSLQDGAPQFFKAMKDIDRHRHGKAIQDYVQKSQFALASLQDEVRLVLNVPAAAPSAARLDIDTKLPAALADSQAAAKGELVDLKRAHEALALVMTVFVQHEVMVAQSERYLDAAKILKAMVDQAELAVATKAQNA